MEQGNGHRSAGNEICHLWKLWEKIPNCLSKVQKLKAEYRDCIAKFLKTGNIIEGEQEMKMWKGLLFSKRTLISVNLHGFLLIWDTLNAFIRHTRRRTDCCWDLPNEYCNVVRLAWTKLHNHQNNWTCSTQLELFLDPRIASLVVKH